MTDKKTQAAVEQAIPDGSENTVADVLAHFKKCGIDPALRVGILDQINPLVQAVHDICVEARVPFIIAPNCNRIAAPKKPSCIKLSTSRTQASKCAAIRWR